MHPQSYVMNIGWRRPTWIALLVTASIAFSLGFACGTPFAAFAAAAALTVLPPKCPELNPVREHLAIHARKLELQRIFASYKTFLDRCCFAWIKLTTGNNRMGDCCMFIVLFILNSISDDDALPWRPAGEDERYPLLRTGIQIKPGQ